MRLGKNPLPRRTGMLCLELPPKRCIKAVLIALYNNTYHTQEGSLS